MRRQSPQCRGEVATRTHHGRPVPRELLAIDKTHVEARKGGYIVRTEVVWLVGKNNAIRMGRSDVSQLDVGVPGLPRQVDQLYPDTPEHIRDVGVLPHTDPGIPPDRRHSRKYLIAARFTPFPTGFLQPLWAPDAKA